MKKFLLALAAVAGLGLSASAAETVLWEGSQELGWSIAPKIEASECADFEVGGDIVVYYTTASNPDYLSLGVINPNWSNYSWGGSNAVTIGSTVKSFGPITEADLSGLKANGFGLMGHNVTTSKITYRTPEGPIDPSVVMKDPVTINDASGSVEVTYDAIVAAGGKVGGGVQVEYEVMEGQNSYVDFLHQGDEANQYTWCQFSNPVVTEKDGISILHLTQSTMDELNSYSKNLIIQCGFVTVNKVKVLTEAEMPDAPASVTLDQTELSLTVGETATLKATVNPAGAEVSWGSSEPTVATVENGKVTALAAGTTTIYASIEGARSASCTVTVKEKSLSTIKAYHQDYGYEITSLDFMTGDRTIYIDFRTEPADQAVTIKLENATPENAFSFYTYKPGSSRKYYCCSIGPDYDGLAGTATLVAYITSDPDVKIEIPVTIKDYEKPTLVLHAWSNPINTKAVSPAEGPYPIWAAVMLPGGEDDYEISGDKTYKYAYSSSDPEVAYVDYYGNGRYTSIAFVNFTGKEGSATIKCVMTPPEGSKYESMEAEMSFTVLAYGEGVYTFDYNTAGWQEKYGFPAEGDFTDFTTKSDKVTMFFSNARIQGMPLPLADSEYEFAVTSSRYTILKMQASTSGGRGNINSGTKVSSGTLDYNTWTADNENGVASVRFTNTSSIQYNMCKWAVTMMAYAIADVALDATEATMEAGDTKQLTATATGDHINPTAVTVWTSSDEAVATVDENGLVTAVAKGTATITAANCGGEATCAVTVGDQSGIEGVIAGEDAPVEYYNLQGVRVENPTPGLYIRRQGTTATKVLLH